MVPGAQGRRRNVGSSWVQILICTLRLHAVFIGEIALRNIAPSCCEGVNVPFLATSLMCVKILKGHQATLEPLGKF